MPSSRCREERNRKWFPVAPVNGNQEPVPRGGRAHWGGTRPRIDGDGGAGAGAPPVRVCSTCPHPDLCPLLGTAAPLAPGAPCREESNSVQGPYLEDLSAEVPHGAERGRGEEGPSATLQVQAAAPRAAG
ncbi:hypothetical protein Anapl_00514 [Anas platyrhynchos]|uniref:Uncharacterized protein n=1 Tax=Anas platyrhynchos TaxID=8839 RepID=R0JU28_ANAPL|nr:hypothetical protein Anapl_00514 [Anas platyrhynchos]